MHEFIFETLYPLILHAIDVILHLDIYLNTLLASCGLWTYAILFLIIFCETGLVVTPFLPGDSLLFALGALAAMPESILNVGVLFLLLTAAAIIGDAVNYALGKKLGPKVFKKKDSRIFKQEYLEKTQKFYAKYGGKTVILARFVPIVRTFAPFVAGIGSMSYSRFFIFNVVGAVVWVGIFLVAGVYFGNIPQVKSNFHIVIVAIIVISVLPMVVEWWKARKSS